MTNKKQSDLKPIKDPVKMRNTKCKRTKNLVKKCLELSQLCELNINITMFDAKKHRIQEICTNKNFTIDRLMEIIEADNHADKKQKRLKIKTRFASEIVDEVHDDGVNCENVSMQEQDGQQTNDHSGDCTLQMTNYNSYLEQ